MIEDSVTPTVFLAIFHAVVCTVARQCARDIIYGYTLGVYLATRRGVSRVVAIVARRRSCLLLPKNNSILISTILHLSMSEPMSYLVTWLLKRLLGRNRFS